MNDQIIKAHVVKEVCSYLNVSAFDLRQKSRKREFVEGRHFIYHFIRKYTRLTYAEIGSIFLQDHATVMCALVDIENLIQFNGYAHKAADMQKRIKNVIFTGTGKKRLKYHYRVLLHARKHLTKIKTTL